MPVDSSIYFQQVTPDYLGSFEKGYRLGDLLKKQQQEQDFNDELKKNIITNPDGSMGYATGTMSKLAQVNPSRAIEFQDKQTESEITKAKKKSADLSNIGAQAEMVSKLVGSVKDETSYQSAVKEASRQGLDITQLPPTFGQAQQSGVLDRLKHQSMTVLERIKVEEAENERNPDSQISKNMQATIAKTSPGKFKPEELAKIPASQGKQILDSLNSAKVAGIKEQNSGIVGSRSVFNADNRAHQRVLQRLQSDKPLRDRVNQYQNLDNALSIITHADALTSQQIHEFQQAVRGNLGIKGTGGVGEREETYMKSLGMNIANWKQFITGDPAELAKDSKMVQHLRQLAQLEQQNINGQINKRIGAVTAGNESVYKRNPELREDLRYAIDAYYGQISPPSSSPPQAPIGNYDHMSDADVDALYKKLGGQ